MSVLSDCPCVQFYAANFVENEHGKNGHVYNQTRSVLSGDTGRAECSQCRSVPFPGSGCRVSDIIPRPFIVSPSENK